MMTLKHAVKEGFTGFFYWYDPSADGENMFKGVCVKSKRLGMVITTAMVRMVRGDVIDPVREIPAVLGHFGAFPLIDDFWISYGVRCESKEQAIEMAKNLTEQINASESFMKCFNENVVFGGEDKP